LARLYAPAAASAARPEGAAAAGLEKNASVANLAINSECTTSKQAHRGNKHVSSPKREHAGGVSASHYIYLCLVLTAVPGREQETAATCGYA